MKALLFGFVGMVAAQSVQAHGGHVEMAASSHGLLHGAPTVIAVVVGCALVYVAVRSYQK